MNTKKGSTKAAAWAAEMVKALTIVRVPTLAQQR
jgi:hypothetical protein